MFSIGTDAHNQAELLFFEFGLAHALKAGLSPKQIVNFWSLDEIVEWAASNS